MTGFGYVLKAELTGCADVWTWGVRKEGVKESDSERPGKLEVGGASRDSTGFGALEEGLISS